MRREKDDRQTRDMMFLNQMKRPSMKIKSPLTTFPSSQSQVNSSMGSPLEMRLSTRSSRPRRNKRRRLGLAFFPYSSHKLHPRQAATHRGTPKSTIVVRRQGFLKTRTATQRIILMGPRPVRGGLWSADRPYILTNRPVKTLKRHPEQPSSSLPETS